MRKRPLERFITLHDLAKLAKAKLQAQHGYKPEIIGDQTTAVWLHVPIDPKTPQSVREKMVEKMRLAVRDLKAEQKSQLDVLETKGKRFLKTRLFQYPHPEEPNDPESDRVEEHSLGIIFQYAKKPYDEPKIINRILPKE